MSYTINPDSLSSLLYPVSYRSIEPSAVVQQQIDVYVGGSLAGSFLAAQTGTSGSSAVFDTNVQSFLIPMLHQLQEQRQVSLERLILIP